MWSSRFKIYSGIQQAENQTNSTDKNFAFIIPKELIVNENLSTLSLFHGGIDSPSLNAFDPLMKNVVRVTKHLRLKSKQISKEYFNEIYERVDLTSELNHPNVSRVISWYVAGGSLYSITENIQITLRQAIQTDRFSLQRIRKITEQILHGTFYLQSKGLCPLTPWYTTSIEIMNDDRILLCSPTISNTKLNGVNVQYHHLWRHAPETLIRILIDDPNSLKNESKEDVWSIGCLITEMMTHQILFRPSNDDPSLQLFSIVETVGGLKESLLERFPSQLKSFFSQIHLDPQQKKLHFKLEKIFSQFKRFNNENDEPQQIENLRHLLTKMLRFDFDQRISLSSAIEHFFFKPKSIKDFPKENFPRENFSKRQISIVPNDFARLCTKFNLKHSRWILTLKERCLMEIFFHCKDSSTVDFDQLPLSNSLKFQLRNFIVFLTD